MISIEQLDKVLKRFQDKDYVEKHCGLQDPLLVKMRDSQEWIGLLGESLGWPTPLAGGAGLTMGLEIGYAIAHAEIKEGLETKETVTEVVQGQIPGLRHVSGTNR